MLRIITSVLIASALLLGAAGCDKKPQRTDDQTPAESDVAEREQPAADDTPAADDHPPTADGDTPVAGDSEACPEPADYSGMCAMVITWALDPDTGTCCEYASPCAAPEDWQTFNSQADCAQAAGQASDAEPR